MLILNAAKLPDPPSSGLITRYVLENPLPASIGLLLIAIVVGWIGLRDGRRSTLGVAGVAALLAVVIYMIGSMVTTAAEHGKQVTKQLVERVIANDLTGAMQLFSDDASVSLASPTNPGMGIDYIRSGLSNVPLHRIQSNRIRMLDGYNESNDVAIVDLGCLTEHDMGWTPSTWRLRLERGDDDQWRISKLTCVSIANQTPRPSWLN